MEIISDSENAFLGRREVVVRLDEPRGITRAQAVEAVARQLGVDAASTYPIVLRHNYGVSYIEGVFYVYKDQQAAKRQLPPYTFKRLLSKEAKAEQKKEAPKPEPKEQKPKEQKPQEDKAKEEKPREQKPKEEKSGEDKPREARKPPQEKSKTATPSEQKTK